MKWNWHISFWCTCFDFCIYCKMIIILRLTSVTIFSYTCFFFYWEPLRSTVFQLSNMQYRVISCSHHTVYYISRTYLSLNWKFVCTFWSPSPISPILYPSPPVITNLYEWVWSFWCFLDSTYKWEHTAFIFLCLTFLT